MYLSERVSRQRPKISSPQLSPKLTDTLHATSLSSQERRNADRNHASVSLAQLQAVNRGDIPHDLSITGYLYSANRRTEEDSPSSRQSKCHGYHLKGALAISTIQIQGGRTGRRKTRQCNYRSRSKSDSNESIVHG